jgi:polysaccharide biosynthesis/export protein
MINFTIKNFIFPYLPIIIYILFHSSSLLAQNKPHSPLSAPFDLSPETKPETKMNDSEERKNSFRELKQLNRTNHEINAYRLKYGDIFEISVYGEELSKREVIVGADGKINYLFVNAIPALGKTISEIRQVLTEKLKKFYRYPLLSIVPKRFSWEYYTIIGQVISPGMYPKSADSAILSALCSAGGFTTRLFRNQTVDTVDFDRSFLAHKGEYIKVDFEKLLTTGDLSWNFPLEGGDYLFFANKGLNKVFILGEVLRSTVIDYLDDITLMQAIAESGGVTDRASSRILVIRGSLAYPRWFYIDSNLIFKGCASDFSLMPNDIVYVPAMQFITLRDIIREGISSFVSIITNVAGTNAFLEITPAAKGTDVVSPVPVFGIGGGTAPVIPSPTSVPVP